MKYLYGIDIGGTTVKMGLFGEDGTLKEKTVEALKEENLKRNGRSRQELRKMERTSCQILHRQ